MSLLPADRGLKSLVGKIAGYSALTAFIFALQIGLPWVSVLAGGKLPKLVDEATPGSWMWFVSSRLRMERMFHPRPQTAENVECISSAICGDELTALLATPKGKAKDYAEPIQLLRCDLRTGWISVSTAPTGVRYLLSDGKTLWQLPAHTEKITPFVWENSPAAVARHSQNRSLRCLIKFVAGEWIQTEQFLLIPREYLLTDSPQMDSSVVVCRIHDQIVTLLCLPGSVYYRTSLELVSKEQADAAFKLKPSRSLASIFRSHGNRFPGWKQASQFHGVFKVQDRFGNPLFIQPDDMSYDVHPYPNIFLENDQLFMVKTCAAQNFGKGRVDYLSGIECINLEDPPNKSYFAPSPTPWETNHPVSTKQLFAGPFLNATKASSVTDRGRICVTTVMNGRTYLLNYDRSDGRRIVLELQGRETRFVGQIGSAIDWRCYVDAAIAFSLVFAIPMLILALVTGIVVWRRGTRFYQTARETTELASIMRRGVARMIDYGLIAAILIWSIISHPAALAWWLLVADGVQLPKVKSISQGISWNVIQQSSKALQEYATTCLAPPCNWWIVGIALMVISVQIVVQGRTGRTLGKWITGIRVVRTTLRPCGIARSVLREIMVLVDGLMFVSWVPGTIAALATSHRQRLGDLMADTIVVVKGTVVGVASNIEPDDVLINE